MRGGGRWGRGFWSASLTDEERARFEQRAEAEPKAYRITGWVLVVLGLGLATAGLIAELYVLFPFGLVLLMAGVRYLFAVSRVGKPGPKAKKQKKPRKQEKDPRSPEL